MSNKICILGNTPLNFMVDISNELVNKGNHVTVMSTEKTTFDSEKESKFEAKMIEELYYGNLKKTLLAFKGLFVLNLSVVSAIKKKHITSIRDLYQFLYLHKYKKIFSQYDVLNLQQVNIPSYHLSLIDNKTKIICSFWGSDVLRKENPSSFIHKFNWVHKASKITISSEKMKSIFESKYGKELNDKLEYVLYTSKTRLFNHIDSIKLEEKGLINIGIGYNGSPSHNHIEILESMSSLSQTLKKKIQLTLLMQYGATQEYILEVQNKVESLGFYNYKINKNLMNLEELAYIRKNTDILIILPISDAFSASVSEALYAGSILICGSWLPYDKYKDNHVYFETIDSISEISSKLEAVLQNFEYHKKKTNQNAINVKKTLDYEGNLNKWVNILSLTK